MAITAPEPQGTALGQSTVYRDNYDPTLLFPISRNLGRDAIGRHDFRGTDIWRCYELTWLDAEGRPVVGAGEIYVPATSPNIVESKSLKLYLGSFTQTRIGDVKALSAQVEEDLSRAAGARVKTRFETLENWFCPVVTTPGVKLDSLGFTLPENFAFEVNPKLLAFDGTDVVSEVLSSDSLRSLCPVTAQPDHASVVVGYTGRKIDQASLWRYIASYRLHRGFHEQCCEQIFTDLMTELAPEKLFVYCCFTRRGGIDISPFRSTDADMPEAILRTMRQ